MKKTIATVCSALLAMSFLLCSMTGCKKDISDKNNGEENTVSTSENLHRDDLPADLKFDQKEVNFVSREFDWYFNEITVDTKDTTDIVNVAVFDREYAVEERLNVRIENHRIPGAGKDGYTVVIDAVQIDQMSGDEKYDIVVNNMYHTMSRSSEGLFYNLRGLNYIDLSKPYYSQNFVDQATIGNSLYAVTGDASLSFIKFAFATFFNKEMVADYHIDDLYQTVLDGEWTYDYQYQLVKDVYTDTNGNLKADDGDTFGLVTNQVLGVDPYWSAFDLSIIKKDTNGELKTGLSNSKMKDALEKINTLFWNSKGTLVFNHKANDDELLDQAKIFAANRAMFTTLRLDLCEGSSLRDMEKEYGIIPMPKYDKNQQQYYSYCHDLFSVFCISSAVSEERLDMVCAVLECFFSESLNCRHQLFEVALKVKYQSDLANSKMLDIIVDHMKIDTGWIYSAALGDFALCMRTLVQAENSSFASYWKMNGDVLKKNLENLVTAMS